MYELHLRYCIFLVKEFSLGSLYSFLYWDFFVQSLCLPFSKHIKSLFWSLVCKVQHTFHLWVFFCLSVSFLSFCLSSLFISSSPFFSTFSSSSGYGSPFPAFCMSDYFLLYAGHDDCYMVKSLDIIVFF